MRDTLTYVGQCHCGNVAVAFDTAKRPQDLGVRACGCSFCRRHGARTTSDPDGRARIKIRDPGKLNRYRFNLHSAEFLICRECGTYMGAVYSDADGSWTTLNVNAFQAAEAFPSVGTPVAYDSETADQRAARRKSKWTPLQGWA